MKGFKYRTVGLAADLMQPMGMTVAQLPGGEIVPAMERGVIDAFEFNNPSSDLRFGAQDVAKNYYLGSYHQASEASSSCSTATSSRISSPTCGRSSSPPSRRPRPPTPALASTSIRPTCEAAGRARRQRPSHPAGHPRRPSSRPGTMIVELEKDAFMKKILDSQRAWVEQVTYYELLNTPGLRARLRALLPGQAEAELRAGLPSRSGGASGPPDPPCQQLPGGAAE